MAVQREDLDKYEREAIFFYYFWFFVYIVIGFSVIILPSLAAMGFNLGFPDGPKYFAGLGAIAAAIFGFLRPNDYAAAFDAAIAEIRSLRARLDILPPEAASDRLDVILRLMSFKYQGSLPSGSKRDPQT